MKKVEYIVHVWLDVENTILGVSRQSFMKKLRSPTWSRRRMQLFENFTLRSLLNQSFGDFQILLFLNPKYRRIHEQFELEPNVARIYDDGKSFYTKELQADHVVIFRTDSDDLLHRDVMQLVKDTADFQNHRTCRVFHRVIQWNVYHKFISDYLLPRSPFTAHSFPRRIYSDWNRIKVEQFMDYQSCPVHFNERKICIIRHGANVTFPRIRKNMRSPGYLKEEMQRRNNIITDRSKMQKILKDFGIQKEQVK